MQLQFPKPTSVSIEINSLQNALIVLCPRAEERYRLRELRAHCCKSVVDVWRHHRVNKPLKKSAALQFS
jgi:hypothetical protein